MSDLPAPFVMSAYASHDYSTKIKLKMPTAHHVPAVGSTSQSTVPTSAQSPQMHGPAVLSTNTASIPPVGIQGHASSAVPYVAGKPGPSALNAAPATQGSSSTQVAVYNQSTYNGTYSQHYPNALYQSSSNNASAGTSYPTQYGGTGQRAPAQPALGQSQASGVAVIAKSPTPPDMQNRRQLRYVSIITKPLGRRLRMDFRDGVKTWAIRLGKGEISVRVADVKLASPGGDGDDSDDEDAKGREKEQEQDVHEDGEDEDEDEVPQEKPVKRGRGRPRKKVRVKTTESPKGKGKAFANAPEGPEKVQVHLNGALMDPAEVEKPIWDVDLQLGSNILEVGEAGGPNWRFYLERLAYS